MTASSRLWRMQETHRLLRQATAPYHARLDDILGGGFDDREHYAGYLRGMRGFLADADRALAGDPMTRRLRAWLDGDCRALGLGPVEPASVPVAAVDTRAARLGWEYVIAGASLGARFLLRDAHRLGYAAGRGASFLAHHAAGEDWSQFLRRLAAETLAPAELPRLCAGAIDAFVAAERRMCAAREVTA